MTKLHTEILSLEQQQLLPFIRRYRKTHFLVGGTALALQLGHRRSIDFDLFSSKNVMHASIIGAVKDFTNLERVLVKNTRELTIYANKVKLTWFKFEHEVPTTTTTDFARMPEPLVLGAMKLFAIGQRAKWKDYVDLYFLSKQYPLKELIDKTCELFPTEFDEKLGRIQLTYFEDVNYSEQVDFMPGFAVTDEKVKKELTRLALQ